MNTEINQKDDVKRIEKIFYVLGNIPISSIGGIFLMSYYQFFHDIQKIDEGLFTLGMGIYAVVNAFNDPLLAMWSDRVDRKKWGSRRLIFIRWGGLVWAIFLVLAWYPWGTSDSMKFWHFLFTMCAMDMGLSIVVMCWMALVAEMTTNVDLRIKLTFIAGILQLFGLVAVLVSQSLITADFQMFRIFNIIIAAIAVVMFFLVSIFCHEREEFVNDRILPLGESIKETFKSKSYMIFIGFNLFSTVIVFSMGLAFSYLYILVLPGGLYVFYAIFFFVKFIGQFVCSKVKLKYGIRGTTLLFIGIQVVCGLVFGVLSIVTRIDLFILIGFVLYTFFGGYSVFSTTLQTLSMDEDELKTGSRRETSFLGVNALITKPGDSLGPIIATWILKWTNYVNQTPENPNPTQPESALNGIRALFLLIPLIFIIIGAIFMYFYPIHGDYMKQMRMDLEKLHEEKRIKQKNQE